MKPTFIQLLTESHHREASIPILKPMNLPQDFEVDIGRLSGCFKHTSATYKFYWLLALLSEVEQGKERIEKKALFAHMVAQAWYTVNYFKVSSEFPFHALRRIWQ